MTGVPVSVDAIACALLAGAAIFGLIHHPAARLQRVRATGRSPATTSGRWSRLSGHPAAAPLRRRLVAAGVAVAALGLLAVRLGDAPPWLVLAGSPVLTLGLAVMLGLLEPLAARRRRHELILQSPQALELLAACLAAGMPVRQACRAVVHAFDGPVGEDLGRVLALVDLGVADAEAWQLLRDHPQLGPAALDLSRSVESGTRMVESLRQHAAAARVRRESALQVQARSVGVRSVLPLMVCFIPSFLLLGVVPSVVSAVTHALS